MSPPVIPDSQTNTKLASRTAENLDENSKMYRDAFVRSYIIDFNGPNAVYRLGYTGEKKNAYTKASTLLREPYVAQELARVTREIRPEDVVTRGQIMMGLLKEANREDNEGGTRVNAWAHLAKMTGLLNGGGKGEDDGAPKMALGVMLVPVLDMNDWASACAIAQASLKANASNHGHTQNAVFEADVIPPQ